MALVLLIDDDDVIRQMMRRMLVADGHDVQEAANGKVGVACYRQQPSDLIITDIVMPEQEGLETIQQLRRVNPQVKIIAISGAYSDRVDGYLAMALRFGVRQVLQKPFSQAELLAAVAGVLATR